MNKYFYNLDNIAVSFSILLLTIYIFVGYLIPNTMSYTLLMGALVCMSFALILERKENITHKQFIIISIVILFIAIQILPAPYSFYSENSINTAINRSIIFLVGIFVFLLSNWYEKGYFYFILFSMLHVCLTIISFLFPSVFYSNILPLLPSEISMESINFMEKGVYAGITDQIGRNAFYISVSIAFLYSYLILKSNRTEKKYTIFIYFLIIMGFLALMITGKRGHLISNIFSMVFIQIIYARIKGKSIFFKILSFAFLLVLLIYALTLLFPEASAPFLRFMERQDGDQTSGRIELYLHAVDLFKEKPFLGWGIGYYNNLYGIGTHNVYLQVLSEHGIVGFSLLSIFLITNIVLAIKCFSKVLLSRVTKNIKQIQFSLYIQLFFILYGFTGNPLNDTFILLMYLMAASIPYTIIISKKDKKDFLFTKE